MKDTQKARMIYEALASVRPVSRPFSTLSNNEIRDLLAMFNHLGKSLNAEGYSINLKTKK